MTILGLYRILLLLCAELFIYSQAALGPYKENYSLALGRTTIQGI